MTKCLGSTVYLLTDFCDPKLRWCHKIQKGKLKVWRIGLAHRWRVCITPNLSFAQLSPAHASRMNSLVWFHSISTIVGVTLNSTLASRDRLLGYLSSVEGCYVECVLPRAAWHSTKINLSQDSYLGHMRNKQIMWMLIRG